LFFFFDPAQGLNVVFECGENVQPLIMNSP
jgi:hypothetical protein